MDATQGDNGTTHFTNTIPTCWTLIVLCSCRHVHRFILCVYIGYTSFPPNLLMCVTCTIISMSPLWDVATAWTRLCVLHLSCDLKRREHVANKRWTGDARQTTQLSTPPPHFTLAEPSVGQGDELVFVAEEIFFNLPPQQSTSVRRRHAQEGLAFSEEAFLLAVRCNTEKSQRKRETTN